MLWVLNVKSFRKYLTYNINFKNYSSPPISILSVCFKLTTIKLIQKTH